MGKHDFRPARVYQTTQMLLQARPGKNPPPWFRVVGDFPPSAALIRPQPVQHRPPRATRSVKKPSRLFQPQRIVYEEDKLRHEFFGDHPWELARPRVILENDGKDYQKWDWSKSYQPGRPVNGESVVQRQRWLLNQTREVEVDGKRERAPMYSVKGSYDQARKEFYELRHREAVEQRVAREEAMATGAYFGKSALDVGMQLENETFEKWKAWANEQVVAAEQAKSAAYTGLGDQPDAADGDADGETGIEGVAEQLGRSVPGPRRGLQARGGATAPP